MHAKNGDLSQFDFLHVSTMRVAVIGAVILIPFSINNFLNKLPLLGLGSMAIIMLLLFNAWSINRGRYYQGLVFYILVPSILIFMFLTFRQQGIIGALWCYPAAIAFYAILPQERARMANVLLLAVVTPCSLYYLETALASRVIATLLSASVFTAIFIHIIYSQQEKLKSLIVTDPLTGMFNRTLLQSSLEDLIAQNNRSGIPVTLIEIDVDNFKKINDTYGHDVGDSVLKEMGKLLTSYIRQSDKVFRLGGEEFLVLLYNTDGERGTTVAEELRTMIAAQPYLPDGNVTASFGVANLVTGENWERWLKRADEKLYQAKGLGRNQVVA